MRYLPISENTVVFNNVNRQFIVALVSISLLLPLISCRKKDIPAEQVDTDKPHITANLDSIYLYAKQIYLWNNQLPDYNKFDPHRFYQPQSKTEIDLYRKELFELSQCPINPLNNKPYEYNELDPSLPKYSTVLQRLPASSFYEKKAASPIEISNAFGLSLVVIGQDDVRLLYVDKNSPAGMAGLKRGDKILSVNNISLKTSESFTDFLSTALKGSFIDLNFQTFDSGIPSNKKVRLTGRSYTPNPVLEYKRLNIGSKSMGYVAYLNFTEESNTRQYIDPAFQSFANAGITDLIIDLRYNGGGFQNSCKYIANQIAPDNANGKVMFTEHYNQTMQQGNASILAQQPLLDEYGGPIFINGKPATLLNIDYSVKTNTSFFENTGLLGTLQTIYFIVSNKTASSSELLINSLTPYTNVVLIGVSDDPSLPVRTYGKPVGFFDIYIGNYVLFLSMYQTKNADNFGDFFDGFLADFSVLDDPTRNFGDPQDPAILAIMEHAGVPGIAAQRSNRIMQRSRQATPQKKSALKYFHSSIFPPGSLIKTKEDLKLKLSSH